MLNIKRQPPVRLWCLTSQTKPTKNQKPKFNKKIKNLKINQKKFKSKTSKEAKRLALLPRRVNGRALHR